MEQFGIEVDPDFTPRYNIAPTQQVPIVRLNAETGERLLVSARWGLIPFWAKDISIGVRAINARSETVLERPTFRDPFRKRRCLIPADGFYEWQKQEKAKQPFCFTMAEENAFAFAGLWSTWRSPEGSEIESCTILTTSPNQLVSDVHDRMPVILPKRHYAAWLETEPARAEQLLDILVPYEPSEMKRYAVSTAVNSAKNNSPEVAKAVGA
jgi:putative SOS response-associated peptidase YedK